MRFAIILAAAMAFGAPVADPNGTWNLTFTSQNDQLPKTVSEMTFVLKADGAHLTGNAHMAGWPGDAPLEAGGVDGDRVWFTVIGRHEWSSGETSGLPKLTFTGTIHADEMNVKLVWDSVMLRGHAPPAEEYRMTGNRISE